MIPEDFSTSMFAALPKKPGANGWELNRTISLMRHIIRLIIGILINRSRKEIKRGVIQGCVFTQDLFNL